MQSLRFSSTRFDPAQEDPNPINPIPGQSVLAWICAELSRRGFAADEVGAEDWGWYASVSHGGAVYLVGASGDAGEAAAPAALESIEWTVHVDKRRSLTDRLLGRNQQLESDSVFTEIERIVRADASVSAIVVER